MKVKIFKGMNPEAVSSEAEEFINNHMPCNVININTCVAPYSSSSNIYVITVVLEECEAWCLSKGKEIDHG